MTTKNRSHDDKATGSNLKTDKIENSEVVLLDTEDEVTVRLLEEELDISKNWVQTGEVTLHKEVVTEDRTITVPITREVLVIEKTTYDEVKNKTPRTHTETIEIPISEERIEIIKHPVMLEDISIYNHRFQEMKHIDETVKKEQIRVDTVGDVRLKDSDESKYSQFT